MATKRTHTKTRAAKKTTKKRTSKRPSKSPPKRTTRAPKASASKRPSRSPAKAAKGSTDDAATNGAAKKAKPARERPSSAPATSGARRTTRPAKLRAVQKSGAGAPRPALMSDVVTVTAPVPEPRSVSNPGRPSGSRSGFRESYLDEVPRDHAELLAGFLKVVKAAAGDIRTLILQAIALRNQKRDRFDR